VVLGYYFRGEGDDTPSIGMLPEPVLDSALPAARWLYRPASHGGNLPELQEAVPSAGFINNPLFDADGVLRRVPLLQAYGDGLYESLALAVTRAALGYPPIDLPSPDDNGEYPPEWLYVGATGVPVDAQAAVLVPYRGRQGSFPYVPAADVLDGSAAAETLAGSIVLIGTTAPGLLDLRATPVQNVYAGVEVHANVIAGILDGRIRHRPDWTLGLELLLLVFIALLLGLVLPRLSPLYMTLTAVAALIAVVGTNLFAWRLDLVLPLASPVLLVLLLTMLYIAHGFFTTTRHKRALARRFGQYVPPELVEEMSQRPEDFSTAGESREMTVLFSDVRGFTSISEGLEARQLTRLMNELLTPMTRVIHDHRGTIDKYMGDAIMAFWGAPLRDPEHARHALDAALEMQRQLHAMQPTFKQRGWPAIRMGIGLNTGTMSVGNMGSEFRMAYTVLGDAVNLGSRLEGLSNVYGVDIIVSDATRAQVSDHVFRELDLVRVKGKDRPVAIFEPLGPASRLDAAVGAELERHHGALALYRHADWDGAETAFRALAEDFPERKVYAIYLERIDAFRQNPPGPDWDGVFVHRSK
jgi:adenylate cyclase